MNPCSSRAFSLVELIVTIAIITFLFGLLATGFGAVTRHGAVQRTEQTLALLDLATTDWERHAGRRLTRRPDAGADLKPETEFVFVITEVLRTVRRAPTARDILARFGSDITYVYEEDATPAWIRTFYEEAELQSFIGEMTVLDAWGVPIYATHPGEPLGDSPGIADTDGTERTPNEYAYGIALNRRVCFVSGGPDRLFGIHQEFPGLGGLELIEAMNAAREDNLYSYEPEDAY